MPRTLRYEEALLALDLQPLVWCVWSFSVPGSEPTVREHRFPPDGAVSLVARPGKTILVGPHLANPDVPPIEPGAVVRGLRLWPGAAPAVFPGVAPSALRDRVELLLPGRHPEPALRLGALLARPELPVAELEEVLRASIRTELLDGEVLAAVFQLFEAGGTLSVGEMAEAVGLSPRQLRRRFRRAVGLSPKELVRIVRARAAAVAAIVGEEPWTAAAAAAGFADQAHLTRELARLTGATPGRLERHARRIRHQVLSGPGGRILEDKERGGA